MNKRDFYKNMQKLEIAYIKKFDKEELTLWFNEFKDVDINKFENAINEHLKANRFAPRIADIWDRIGERPMTHFTEDPYAYLYKNLEWCEIVKEE